MISSPVNATLLVAPDASWFKLNDQPVVDISTRHSLRRILLGLTELRLAGDPWSVLRSDALFEVGWPGERANRKSAATRVYTAIHTLRGMYGLDAVLRRAHRGYFLAANVRIARSESSYPEPISATTLLAAAG